MPYTDDICKSRLQYLEEKNAEERAQQRRQKENEGALSNVGLTRKGLQDEGYVFYDYDGTITVVNRSRTVGRLKGRGFKSNIYVESVTARPSEIESALAFRGYLDGQGINYVDLKWCEILEKLEDKRSKLSGLIRKVKGVVEVIR